MTTAHQTWVQQLRAVRLWALVGEGWPCEHDWLRPRYASNAHILLLALFFSQLNSHVLVVGHVLGRVLIWLLLYGSRLAQCRSSTVQVKFVLCQ